MSRDLRATATLEAKDNTATAFSSAKRRLEMLEARMKTFNAAQRTMERSSVGAAERGGAMRGGAMRGSMMGRMAEAGSGLGAGGALLAGRMMGVGGGALGVAGAGAFALSARRRYADVERSWLRIGITGDATNEEIASGMEKLRDLALQVAMPFDQIREGMDAVTASGRQFSEAMQMMPSIAKTAQASGAKVDDIAKASTAMVQHLKIPLEELQAAQDVIAAGGKLGQFELKDMARYLPSFMPAGYLAGFKGQAGLQKMVAMLQTVREGSGTSEEAASSWENIMGKFESTKTQKELQDMLEKMGAKADYVKKRFDQGRKSGENLVEVFLELTKKATKGDYSKLGDIIDDTQFKRGVVALLTMEDKLRGFEQALKDVGGTVDTDFNRVLKTTQTNIDRLSESWDRWKTSTGKRIVASGPIEQASKIAQEIIDNSSQAMEDPNSEEKHQQLLRDAKTTMTLRDALRDSGEAGSEIERLFRERGKGPLTAPFIENMNRLRKQRSEAQKLATETANKLIPKPTGPDGFYEVLPVGAEDTKNARDRGYGFRPAGWNVGASLDKAKPGQAVNAPLPPRRPNGGEMFPDVGPLDFGPAKASAEQGKADIEALLRGMDLAAAGQQAGSTFRGGLVGELKQAESEATGIVGRIKSMLSFTATPTVRVGLNPGNSTAGTD